METFHFLNRIGFGPRHDQIESIEKAGAETYIAQQLHPERVEDGAAEARLTSMRPIRMTTAEILAKTGGEDRICPHGCHHSTSHRRIKCGVAFASCRDQQARV